MLIRYKNLENVFVRRFNQLYIGIIYSYLSIYLKPTEAYNIFKQNIIL